MTTLTKNKTKVTLGTVVKIWHGTRGHDYVVVGVDTNSREVHLIKHNSINQDGSIHAATAEAYFSHKKVSYNTHGIITGISTVLGQCKRLNVANLTKHFGSTTISPAGFNGLNLYSTATIDRRDSFVY